jgi:hypothetical protein
MMHFYLCTCTLTDKDTLTDKGVMNTLLMNKPGLQLRRPEELHKKRLTGTFI